ncbi:MAG: helicase [Flavipsychrobacter sp.]|jgi:non-specific serine/threonine protein kinase|nr:helicase [Flavipsychrobacter sp.]
MAEEKELLITFLKEYSPDAVDKALGKPLKYFQKSISLAGISEGVYKLYIKSASSPGHFYFVSISIGQAKEAVIAMCDCPAMERFGSCKHVAACTIYILINMHKLKLYEIEEMLEEEDDIDDDDDFLPVKTSPTAEPKNTTPPSMSESVNEPEYTKWHSFISPPGNVFYNVAPYRGYVGMKAISSIELTASIVTENEVHIKLTYKKNKTIHYHPQIRYNKQTNFFYACDCPSSNSLCEHVRTAFSFIEQKHGRDYFQRLKDYSEEKNKLLQPYGITLADKEAENFIFTIDSWGGLSMKAPSWLWKTDIADSLDSIKKIFVTQDNQYSGRHLLSKNVVIDFEIGFLFNMASQHFRIGFEFEPVKVFEKAGKTQFKKLVIHQRENLSLLGGLPDEVYGQLVRFTDDAVKQHLSGLGFGHLFNYSSPWQNLTDNALKALLTYYIGALKKIWPYLCEQTHVYMLKEGVFSTRNLLPVKLSPSFLNFGFTAEESDKYITINLQKIIEGAVVDDSNARLYNGFLFEINGMLYLPADIGDLGLLKEFVHGFIKVPLQGKKHVITSLLPMLQRKYPVQVAESLTADIVQVKPEPQLLLKEMDNKFLVLQPQFNYNGVVIDYETNTTNIFREMPDGKYVVIERDTTLEKNFFDSLRILHPKFEKPTNNNFFFLYFEETMKQNWFINAVGRMVENGITVLGMQDLQKHRYNTNQPKWEMKTGSGIDWFDLKIEVSFGEQVVPMRDIRKALLNKQNIVVLGDGTFGVLPEEWIKQYSLVLKIGEEQKNGTLRLSKLHYTLIDELHSQIDNEAVQREIEEKKQRLKNIGEIGQVKPGRKVKAKLRPYQTSGFQWFHTLDEMGWGGCLADDMGLGKTLQAIAFLQYLKEKYSGSTHLVICPTSLIYNWESELQKFCPSLRHHIYYGTEREFTEEHFSDYDIVITSYGILRNDLEQMQQFDWSYIILDESQAIKNPDSQTNKALQLLKSKNRMILSGTPVQNNTFDLYAQFNFINPGLLGSREFFKTEFANPIDKNNDAEKSAQLRRLIYPFMLRRTKEQVAKDLPDKTETIIWCEMGRDQRSVYNDYKNYYRNTLLQKIEEVGMAKAGMYVLEGLLRLRQICDSPVLVKDKEVTTKKSVKIDELLREIKENSGGHKSLVFSQFTEMLHLLEDAFRAEGITYTYFDGSTPAAHRKVAVESFQNNPDIRVFLISLKAGGVGLNLTAADYVYIVDPWWNPAVEQQAIDRTHRIGQVNKIFAYKMICKDTVEEKIVQLQQKKKQLANDLVAEDAGFIKKLNKDDIAFLFS